MRSRLVPVIAVTAAVVVLIGLVIMVVRTSQQERVSAPATSSDRAAAPADRVAAEPPPAPSTGGPPGATAAPPVATAPPVAPADAAAPADAVAGRLSPPGLVPGPSGTVRLEPYPSAEVLAAHLAAAETLIRADDVTGDELVVAGLVQQFAYRELGLNPDWIDVVRGLLPEALRPAYDANLAAQGELVALTAAQEDLPSWTIVPPPPADELVALYQATAAEFGIDWTYLAAIHLVETRMGRIRGGSSAGAQGPMQFIPPTWEIYGEGDIQDTGDAVRAAARYLTARGAPGDMDRALYAYNNSDRYVRSIQSYAAVMRAEPRTYRGYYGWQVFYRLASGTVLLQEGWSGG